MADYAQSPLLMAVLRARRALERRDAETMTRLVNAYGRIWLTLQEQLKGIEDAILAGKDQEYLRERVLALARQVEEEVSRYAIYADQELEQGARQAIAEALRDAARLVSAAYGPYGSAVVQSYWHYLPADAVETMSGMLGPQSPLRGRMEANLGHSVAEQVANGLLEGVALGYNPVKVQRLLRQKLGQGLTWSIAATRTAQIWAYREATRAGYAANSHIVREWIWHSALAPTRTCLSCVAMHGTRHPHSEVLNDHYQGLCAMLPVTASWAELGFEGIEDVEAPVQPGTEWFKGLPESEQAKFFVGEPAKWAAWKAGQVKLEYFVSTYRDDVYGEMRVEASLKGILGDRAREFYQRAA